MKYCIDINSDEFDAMLIKRLQETNIAHVTNWKAEPHFEVLSDALLTVLDHFMVYSEFNDWYETIKEL
jgi:hypothetical protein